VCRRSARCVCAIILYASLVSLLSSCAQTLGSTRVLSGAVTVDSTIVVGDGETLEITAGTVVRFRSGAGLLARDGGIIRVHGTELSPVRLFPADATPWDGILASGDGSKIVADWFELASSFARAKDGASLELRNGYLHDYTISVPPIVEGDRAASVLVSGCVVRDYYELHFYRTVAVIENSVLSSMRGDGIDFDNSPDGCVVRACTLRDSSALDAIDNADGIDFGTLTYPYGDGSRGLVDSCDIHDLSDKGVSVGELARGVKVTNTLIRSTNVGIASKDSSIVTVERTTIVGTKTCAFNLYEERAELLGGKITGTGLVVWNNLATAVITSGGILDVTGSCVPDIAGTGNVAVDPSLDSSFIATTVTNMGIEGKVGASDIMLERAEKAEASQ